MSDKIALTQLAGRLRPSMGDKCPNYHKLYFLGLSGRITLRRDEGSRGYYVLAADLPQIEAAVIEAGRSRRAAQAA